MDWDFLKICDVPVGCALPMRHPLASRKLLHYQDLAGQTAMSIRHGSAQYWSALVDDLLRHEIQLKEVDNYSGSVMWDCICSNSIILAPFCWQDVLFDTVMVPCDWSYSLPYGFCHSKTPAPHIQKFLDFIDEIYHGDKWQGAVPVF
jgi:hypothetical protein